MFLKAEPAPAGPAVGERTVLVLDITWRPPEAGGAWAADGRLGARDGGPSPAAVRVRTAAVGSAAPTRPRGVYLDSETLVIAAHDSSGRVVHSEARPDPARVISDDFGVEPSPAAEWWLPEAALRLEVPPSAVSLTLYRPVPGRSDSEPALRAVASAPVPAWPRAADGGPASSSDVPDRWLVAGDGRLSNRVDWVLLPEAYTQADYDTCCHNDYWPDKARNMASWLLAREPFKTFRGYINIWTVNAVSNVGSIGQHGSSNDTYFRLARHGGRSSNYKVWDAGAVSKVLNGSFSGISVETHALIGSEDGGGGIAVGRLVVAPDWPTGVLAHEIGHAFGRLADEYTTHTCSNPCGSTLQEVNVTCTANVGASKWAHWAGEQGVNNANETNYKGAKYCHHKRWRPMYSNLMRTSNHPTNDYGPINREGFVRQIYSHTSSIDSTSPARGAVEVPADCSAVTFSIETPPHRSYGAEGLSIRWKFDGTAVDAADDLLSYTVDEPCDLAAGGSYPVSVEVSDGTAFVRSDPTGLLIDTASWSLDRPNSPPEAVGSLPSWTAAEGAAAHSVDASSAFTDPDDDTLSYAASVSDPAVASASAAADGTVTLTPGDPGSALVTVTASDGIAANASAEQQFAVTVTAGPLTVTSAEGRAPGRPWPVCENTDGAFFSVTNPYSAKTLAVSLEHAKDGEVQGYVPAPPLDRDLDLSISLAGSTAPLTSFTVARGATVALQARAADDADAVNGVLKASFRLDGTELGRVYLREIDWEGGDTWNVCRYNQPPETIGTIPNISAPAGSGSRDVSLAGVFSDPEGDALTYSAASTDTAVAAVSITGGDTVGVVIGQAGSATVTVTATDAGGSGGEATAAFTVTAENRPPETGDALPGLTLTAGAAAATVDLAGAFTDPDGDALTFTASSSDTATVGVTVQGAQLAATPLAAGSATVTVSATDAAGSNTTASQTFTVNVEEAAAPAPVLELVPPPNRSEGTYWPVCEGLNGTAFGLRNPGAAALAVTASRRNTHGLGLPGYTPPPEYAEDLDIVLTADGTQLPGTFTVPAGSTVTVSAAANNDADAINGTVGYLFEYGGAAGIGVHLREIDSATGDPYGVCPDE